MSDHYQVPAAEAAADLRIQRSRFRGIVFPAQSEDEFTARLEALQKEHFDATHHCWAFRFFDPPLSRSSDAGEPSGTAGRPIAQAIESSGLSNAGVVVVRWYGGVKLGTGGLARAYRDAAAAALAATAREDRWLYEPLRVRTHHRDANLIFRMVDPPNVVLDHSEFGERAEFHLLVRRSLLERIREELEAKGIRDFEG